MRVAMAGVLAAVVLVVLAACQPRPAATIAVSLYRWNQSDQPFAYRVLGTPPGSEEWAGLVPDVASSAGCGSVEPDWELVVTAGEDDPDPADQIAARAAAADFGNRDPVAIALTIAADGSIDISGGVPDWWESDIQRCP